LHDFGDLGNREIAPAVSLIKGCIDRLYPVDRPGLGDCFSDARGQTVGQPENDVLDEVGRMQVG
jgi:hypothetical protein